MSEFYPSIQVILEELENEAVLVGSAVKNAEIAKDLDVVVSRQGLTKLLRKYGFYLVKEKKGWYVRLPMQENEKALDIFCGIQPIENEGKHAHRVTFEEAFTKANTNRIINGVQIRAYSPV